MREQVSARERARIRGELREQLHEALATKPEGEYIEGDEAWEDWCEDHHVSLEASGGEGPLFLSPVYGSVTAWVLDPTSLHDDTISVTEDES